MKIALEGRFEVAASPEKAYDFLTDPAQFGPLLPMYRELKDVQADHFGLVLDVGVPQIRGRAEAEVRFTERRPGEKAAFTATVKHALGMADATLSFALAPSVGKTGGGTAVSWTCESLVRGTLASLAAGLLKPLARRNVDAMIASVQQALGAREAA